MDGGQTGGVVNPWAFELHLEVLVLVAFLAGSYLYLVRVIGPVAVEAGEAPVSRGNLWCFGGAITMLLVASWWPMHDIGERYLYSAHMLQHMMLSYFLPPLALLATPAWLLRTLIGNGALYRAVRFLCKPVVAGVVFNLGVMITHVPGLVNASTDNGLLHYLLHVLVVSTGLLMWMPVCGPLPELRIGALATMVYLFAQSIIPTVPAGWLTFAESAVYRSYDIPFRLWGLSVRVDQQVAGAIMKTGGTIFLWSIIVTLWFKRFAAGHDREYDFRRSVAAPIESHGEAELSYAEVERAFAASAAPEERSR